MIKRIFNKTLLPLVARRSSQRYFNLHEYQSKQLMKDFNISVQKGGVAINKEQASKIAHSLKNKDGLILKAQVHAGGRGKGTLSSGLKGGVQICSTPQQIQKYTEQMIGYNLVTKQTPKDGLLVNAVMVHQGINIDKQIYLAIMADRKYGGMVIIGSSEGGVQIQEVAQKNPDAIHIHPVDVMHGLSQSDAQAFVKKLGFDTDKSIKQASQDLVKMYKMALQLDASQVEINPWATTPENDVFCVDAKINIDDNASFRQQKLLDMRRNSLATEQVDQNEEIAEKAGFSYVGLDGNIGCMVNGAGLAMSTMDIIKLKGGQPANFLDVGGSANKDQIRTAFTLLTNHKFVQGILVNVFAGIANCKSIAEGMIDVLKEVDIKLPMVVRLTGNQSDVGTKLIEEFITKQKRSNIEIAKDFDQAAQKIVSKVKN